MLSKLRIFFSKMFTELAFMFANIIFIISISFGKTSHTKSIVKFRRDLHLLATPLLKHLGKPLDRPRPRRDIFELHRKSKIEY